MTKIEFEQIEDSILNFDVSDEALESAGDNASRPIIHSVPAPACPSARADRRPFRCVDRSNLGLDPTLRTRATAGAGTKQDKA